ncbi:TNT domain-containing protein [Streptomyces sp. NPDC052040]|uniref:TNT domain-containing protein n=1 Tax=unclassified Streptomyces TaxID=2593676 RepID=UPI0037D86BCC
MRLLPVVVRSALASLLLLLGIAPATAQATEAGAAHRFHCPTMNRDRGTNTAPPPLQRYYRMDWRLGPAHLPRSGPLGRMLRGYHRTDDTTASRFIRCFWQTNPATTMSGWWYPNNNGFVLRNGRPVEHPQTLRRGQLLDLFGSGFGHFLAPAGTPYARRAIPPSNLDTYDPNHPFSYHLYRVVRPFTVAAGPIRPWFGQPGLGLQYLTTPSIPDLVASHNLKELPVT